ncbi:MAG: YicC family protein [Thermoanaerobacteraceae bacterium]|nr:YicC family protein [Thermoanaerobacteraceae bacterium]
MIKSMTGYGRGENQGKFHFVVEIRSVNHRFLEVFVRLPKPWLFLEDKIKNHIKGKIKRGRLDVFISVCEENLPVDIKIDKSLVSNYYKKLIELKNEIGFEGQISLSLLSLMPNVLKLQEDSTLEEELWPSLMPALDEALNNLIKMRIKEGENLWNDLNLRLKLIQNKIQLVQERANVVPQEYKEKLMCNIQKLMSDALLDEDRIEAEVVMFAEKANIIEEIVRLRSHLAQMQELSSSNEAVGKKMDFIAQEMFREANTISVKASDYYVSREIIDIKSELEKIREQIQNIE